MSRSQRLLDLLQLLRRYRRPIQGRVLADALGISLRSLYRDIAALQAQGADIQGEAGIGYQLKPGYLLPPLMFSEDELEALLLGAHWVMDRADARLGEGAENALAKIAAILPRSLRDRVEDSALIIGPSPPEAIGDAGLLTLRLAMRHQQKLKITYCDLKGKTTKRVIWPVALAFFEHVRVLVAWCELRNGFRHFRTDHIQQIIAQEERSPRSRKSLLAEWRRQENIPTR